MPLAMGPHHGLILLEGSERGVSSSTGVHCHGQGHVPPPRDCHPACSELGTPSQWEIGDCQGHVPKHPPEPGFGVQLAETQCGGCPRGVGDASRETCNGG